MESALTKAEIERYSRQILFFGKAGQLKLKHSHVLLVGAGGLGCASLPYLVASGVGKITLLDDDLVSRPNLSRQVLFSEKDIGAPKVEVARKAMAHLNPHVSVNPVLARLSPANASRYLAEVNLVLEGSDSVETKFLVNRLAMEKHIPAFIGGLGPAQGHLIPAIHSSLRGHPGPCYQCIFESPPKDGELPSCATDGILSPLAGVLGSFQAYQAVEYLALEKRDFPVTILENGKFRHLTMNTASACPINH